jgi:hypothetical protein
MKKERAVFAAVNCLQSTGPVPSPKHNKNHNMTQNKRRQEGRFAAVNRLQSTGPVPSPKHNKNHNMTRNKRGRRAVLKLSTAFQTPGLHGRPDATYRFYAAETCSLNLEVTSPLRPAQHQLSDVQHSTREPRESDRPQPRRFRFAYF